MVSNLSGTQNARVCHAGSRRDEKRRHVSKGGRAAAAEAEVRVRADIIGHARINMYVNLIHAWLKMADYIRAHRTVRHSESDARREAQMSIISCENFQTEEKRFLEALAASVEQIYSLAFKGSKAKKMSGAEGRKLAGKVR